MNFSNLLNPVFLDSFLSTNFSETAEFIGFYTNIFAYAMLILFLLLSVLFLSFRFSFKPKVFSKKAYFALFILSVCIVSYKSIGYSGSRVAAISWYQTISEGIRIHKEYKDLSVKIENLAQNYSVENKGQIPKVVFIIGESTQRNYMSLYGYGLKTSPYLENLRESKNLFVFSDTISPHSHTNESLSKVLTFSNYENASVPFYKQANIIDIMKKAGYKTQSFSNQDAVSVYGNVPESILGRADIRELTSMGLSGGIARNYDEKLLEIFKQKSMQTDKDFYVFHLLGTHISYKHRYNPHNDKVAYFTQDDLAKVQDSAMPLSNEQLDTKLHYINAVAYNDYVVSEIINLFKEKNVIIFYLSDHADEVYDFRDFAGHTETMGSRFMIEVPFMIYASDKFKSAYPAIIQRIENALDKPFMSDDFIHSFLDILNIQTQDLTESRSIFSDSFNASRKRIFAGKDYDLELKGSYPFTLPSRIWLHRTDEIGKFEIFKKKYQNFEIDVHFIDGIYDVGHDGMQSSIGLNLQTMLEKIVARKSGLAHSSRLWIDFKNLSQENKLAAVNEMNRICEISGFDKKNLIIESPNFESLDAFKQDGFYTSYYVPYYDEKSLKADGQKIKKHIESVISTGNIDALSFAYYLYPFIKSGAYKIVKNNELLDIDLLTWTVENPFSDIKKDIFFDPQIKVILSGESGKWR